MENENIIMDFERRKRCAIEEAVFCEFKTPDQLEQILTLAKQNNKTLLFTRLNQEKFFMLSKHWQTTLTYHPVARCAVLGELPKLTNEAPPLIAIVSAGSSDASVCHEALLTLNYHGIAADLFQDIGVAGLWRLLDKLPQLQQYSIIIAVAGMEAALPTVLAGLVDAPIIAVPTSIGYGISVGGNVALQSCLSSCAGGVMTVNIDNGYGSACAAIKIYKKIVNRS
ncbi:nickel pincer cofactor biosynthesis protein LarB [Entomomonas moraniae]|uniref:Nickel pincer cofactor biosynthesis protein LarB n=1 Tax=Entomomonas moraniae TaxID=2213226 RepID=A0A3S9XAU8_9GAMM|nr:nickel pincer cofactor biosynthesis protein LarB [Entomomonas moraniae]AZS49535.1 nickel pincer cofactor biosynthesis protein LarB [Entomomonas moraniae]